MPSNSNSRASGPKSHSKTAPPKVNGGGQVAGAKSNAAPVKPPQAQSTIASTSDSKRNDPGGNAPSQSLDTPNNGLRTENGSNSTDGTENAGPTVNRKKQKRRLKQAARLAAEKPSTIGSSSNQAYVDSKSAVYNGTGYALSSTQPHSAQVGANGYDYEYDDAEYEPEEGEDQFYSDENARLREKPHPSIRLNGSSNGQPSGNSSAKAKKKKKNKSGSELQPAYQPSYDTHSHSYSNGNAAYQQPPPPPPPTMSTAALRSARSIPKDRIWNTSTAEERERIKEFWLTLGEGERRSLVKVEKDAVLKKMKEQQKHSCSCTVCGRKRTAIEEELEVLYDAYYEELEQYANNQQGTPDQHTSLPPTSGMFGHRNPPNRATQDHNNARSSGSRIQEIEDDEDEGDDEDYDDEDGDDDEDGSEDISDGEPEEPMGPAADFFNFGNSLTVQGGILTVADDLLKNDGKKFIEMMEQLAERRMQREEEAQYQNAGLRHPGMQAHNHGPPLDDEAEYDEEDEEDYDSQDEDYEEDEMEPPMTEQQRMEEGRRMFQIFAARMFEQRVLTAYREKVSRERQEKLIEELDEESRLDTQREAKKAREAQKKKDKKRQQKQAKDEEKAKREAEKAAEEAALKAVEEKKLEEQRQKKEEQRKKREAERKAQEEEKQRKEAEKQKRLQEAREQQADLERKQREAKDREKKKREEARKKEREERETKEREAREKKEREAAEKKEREDRSRFEKEEKDRKKAEEHAPKQAMPAPVVPNLPPSTKPNAAVTSAPHISGLIPAQTASSHASPHLPIATPIVPKAPTPIRARQPSFQDSHNTSPKTSLPPAESSATSPSAPSQASNISIPPSVKTGAPPQNFPQDQQISNLPPVSGAPGPPTQPPGFSGPPAMTMGSFPSTYNSILPNVSRGPLQESSIFQHQAPFNGNHFRPFGPPPGMTSLNMIRPITQSRSGGMEPPSPQIPLGPSNAGHIGQYRSRDTMPTHSHSRQSSATVDRPAYENYSNPAQTQPIARPNPIQPTPIQRPSSVAPHPQSDVSRRHNHEDIEKLSNHLGSSALLEDTDVPIASNASNSRRGSLALGGSRPTRQGFNAPMAFQDPIGTAKTDNFHRPAPLSDSVSSTWNPAQVSMNGPLSSGPATWSNASRPGWPANYPFSPLGGPPRSIGSRALTIRQLVVQACTKLTARPTPNSRGGYHNVQDVLREVIAAKPPSEGPISLDEMLEICDTEGNTQNGGGTLRVEIHGPAGMYVKFEPGRSMSMGMGGGMGPGDIGSPAIGYSRLG